MPQTTRRPCRGDGPSVVALLLLAVMLGTVLAPARGAEPTAAPLAAADVDVAACASFAHGKRQAVAASTVLSTLGLGPQERNWSAGRHDGGEQPTVCHYLIAFKRALPVGALLVDGSFASGTVARATAPYPPDPAVPEHWLALADTPGAVANGWATLPPGLTTRAVLVTSTLRWGTSVLESVRLTPARLLNVAPQAGAFADSEYTQHFQGAPPLTHVAWRPLRGGGQWQSTGPDDKGLIPRGPVSAEQPNWFILSWPAEQTVSGLWLESNIVKFELRQFVGGPAINPRAGTEAEWKTVRDVRVRPDGRGQWVSFAPLRTRGLELRITQTGGQVGDCVAQVQRLLAFQDLGDQPVPPPPPGAAGPGPSPVRIAYDLPLPQSTLTLVVNRPDGSRVRNLLTRQPRAAGHFEADWDLKDEFGQMVTPGAYRWEAIYHPPLKLRYEMTAYPNVGDVAPENSAWLNGHSGPGGWLADHTSNRAVATFGERVYMGSPVSESGVSLIETDLRGHKLWGYSSFAGFTGVWYLATDGRTVFVSAQATNMAGGTDMDPRTEPVWAVDVASKQVRTLAMLAPKADRDRGIVGMAARDGRLYLSIRGREDAFANAFGGRDVDLERCFPKYPPRRKERFAHEIVPDPRSDTLRLLRVQGVPPGYGDIGLTYLESARGPESRQHLVITFTRPVPIGSAMVPGLGSKEIVATLSVLKPDAPLPPQPDKAEHWLPFERQAQGPWDVAVAPPGVETRALRVTFTKGRDDVLTDLGADDAVGGGRDAWGGRLEGLKLFRRRFTNLAGSATVRVSSGKVAADGVWKAACTAPLTDATPAVYALEWPKAVTVRGLALKELDGELAKVDVFTGDAGAAVGLEPAAAGWEEVATYRNTRRDLHSGFESYNGGARYLDGYVDFGRDVTTRAVRVRVVKQWSDRGNRSDMGDRVDRFGPALDPKRCHLYGVAALASLGGEPPVDPRVAQRVEVLDGQTGAVVEEYDLKAPGDVALGPQGQVYAVSAKQVVRLAKDAPATVLVTDLLSPGPLACDRAGNLYVFDGAKDRQQVRVYDPAGKFLRTVGTAGGHHAGPWDPSALWQVVDLAVDQQDQLWAVEQPYWPKRIVLFGPDGAVRQEFLGPTAYGGGGVLDPYDKSRLFYGPLEFALDWTTGRTRLKNLTVDGAGMNSAGELPVELNGRRYLVTRPEGSRPTQGCGIVWLYEQDHLKLAAAVGRAEAFFPFLQASVHAQLNYADLPSHRFRWSDRNGDGQVQGDEVVLTREPGRGGVTQFNRDLGVQYGSLRYQVKEVLPSGVPVYEEVAFPQLPRGGFYWHRLDNGNFQRMKNLGEKDPDGVFTPDGKMVWTYPSEQPGTHGYARGGPYHPGQVLGQYTIIGHETAPAGDLGEFFVYNGNTGNWHLWTADGLLAAHLFVDLRDRRARNWSFREHERGLDLSNVTIGQEHFAGYFGRTFADNKFYAIAGHNHASVVEVQGLEQFKRLRGDVAVTEETLKQTLEWERTHQQRQVFARAPVVDVYRLGTPPRADGNLGDWPPGGPNASIVDDELASIADFWLGFDDQYLYLAYRTRDLGPLVNPGEQWDRLFKTGAAVDLQIATDPAAPADRKAPVAGDQRLLMTWVGKRPTAVLYRAVVPGTPEDKVWHVNSPVAHAAFDEVRQAPEVSLGRSGGDRGYVVEAVVPLKLLGLKLTDGMRVKLDWGMLVSDESGNQVMQRLYWANKATGIVADAPSEARLQPELWGHAIFHFADRDPAKREAAGDSKFGPTTGDKGLIDDFGKQLKDDLK